MTRKKSAHKKHETKRREQRKLFNAFFEEFEKTRYLRVYSGSYEEGKLRLTILEGSQYWKPLTVPDHTKRSQIPAIVEEYLVLQVQAPTVEVLE